ncbi:hypothetical protein FAVG1_13156 [Fusarium avenaceum]|nr:hypothetical protein FAVG1_13156 [Fusarium avenaceum]
MRLINADNLELETWGSDNEEVSFEDMKVENTQKVGMQKVIGCCQQAKADDIKYVWIDTCCINKDSSKELDEAINSMFQWYRRASVCYTYLTDVAHDDDPWDPTSKFYSSSWFRRGWTLQELLAPGVLRFYSQNWDLLGTKADLSGEIEKITGIPRKFLLGWVDFHQASVAQRMSWASKRETKREEDMAYCLLGIFNVTMPMIYGEGRRAFQRLQLRIMEQTTDESILAWGMPSPGSECLTQSWEDNLSSGVFGSSPADFVNCGDIVPRAQDLMPANTFLISGGYVRTTLKLKSSDELGTYALLNCGPEHSKGEVIAIPLVRTSAVLSANEYIRPQEHHPIRINKSQTKASIQEIGIRVEPQVQLPQVVGRRFWLHIDGHQKLKLNLRQTWPPLQWEKGRALIAIVNTNQFVLNFNINGRQSSVDCYTITTPTDSFALEEIGESLDFIRKEDLETKIAGDETFAVKFAIVKDEFAQETIFYLTLTETTEGATINANVHRQISIAKTKGEFLKLVQEEEWARSYAERNLEDLTAAKKDLESFGKVLSDLEEKERRLAREKKSVRTQMRQVTDNTRRLDQLWTLLTAVQQQHKVQRKTLEATLDDTEMVQGPGNWLEGFIQRQLNKAREVQEKSDHSETGLQQPKYPVDNQQNMGSFVPLLWAAANGQDIIAGILLEKGSSVNIKDDDNNTALLFSASCGHRDTASLLLTHGALLEAKNKDGDTPLARTAYKGHVSTAALLLEKGADIEALNNFQSTPLAIAARQGHVDVVTLLLQNGANYEAVNHYGDTPLSRAATHGHQDVVRALLEKGAKVEVRNKKGFTPLQLATKNGHEAVVKLLQFGDAVDDNLLLVLGIFPANAADAKTELGMFWMMFVGRGVAGFGAGDKHPTCGMESTEASDETSFVRRRRGLLVAAATDFSIDLGFVMAGVVALIVLDISYLLVIKRYWKLMLGISLAWFFYDFMTYPFGIFSLIIIATLNPEDTLEQKIGFSTVINYFYLPGRVVGGLLMNCIGRRHTMTLGFLGWTILGFIIGGPLSPILSVFPSFIVLYGILNALGEMGPSVATFLYAAESFPTPSRGHFLGFTAAIGKAGAAIATQAVTPIYDSFSDKKRGIQAVFLIGAAFAGVGGLVTWFLLPDKDKELESEYAQFWLHLEQNGYKGSFGEVMRE